MKTIAALAVLASAAFAFASVVPIASAAELAPRAPGAKASYQAMVAQGAADRVTVKFREGRKVRLKGAALDGLSGAESKAFRTALEAAGAGGGALSKLHSVPEETLDAQRAEAQAEAGEEIADLNLYYVLQLPAGANAAAVADRLNGLPFVEYAAPAPRPAPPPVDIAPTTPKFVSQQGYLKGRNVGVGALSPDVYPGGNGKGIRVVDVEYSWRLDHEDLEIPADRVLTGGQTASDPFSNDHHGTAVLGEIVGKKNAYGVTGIAPGATAYVAPAMTTPAGYTPARAIITAGQQLRRGDVLIIEQQYWVCGYPTSQNRYGPLETLQDVFDAVSTLTGRGVIVVAAAGNGAVNLDAPECAGQFDRKVRNSRALIVGASSSTDHSRLSFSSYGSRVDVQGWGENVVTTGYGDLFFPADIRQAYTSGFNGTSSATPIVTGAVAAIQGVRKACGLGPLSPKNMRKALVSTGTPQGGDASTAIGPLPRILPALKSTDARPCVRALERAAAPADRTASLD
ncbi:MAG: hypothetical protein DI565_00290 [Ancylobacter novellus]|uniref:Peptidase S8/S53 domain-containing protein n=1 Tax=Ancylobacter novellus TaxID=921 RepID=A0A2W5KP97_ANCNO|nr:MAG: hypothetical protein DI565_00290 [Ancylobacter novellus]